VVRGAGFDDVEIVWSTDAFYKGASGEADAESFGTVGINLRARRSE
jgi:hypothetical protein